VTVLKDECEYKMGLRGVETCAVSFNGTSVPEMNVLRGIGHGNDVIRKIFEEQVCAFFMFGTQVQRWHNLSVVIIAI